LKEVHTAATCYCRPQNLSTSAHQFSVDKCQETNSHYHEGDEPLDCRTTGNFLNSW